jgi:hypothetical protein
VGYATGQTDEWRGTGVWSGLSLKREDKDNTDDSKNDNKKELTPPSQQSTKETANAGEK